MGFLYQLLQGESMSLLKSRKLREYGLHCHSFQRQTKSCLQFARITCPHNFFKKKERKPKDMKG